LHTLIRWSDGEIACQLHSWRKSCFWPAGVGFDEMTFKIQKDSDGQKDILRLAGRIHAESLEELKLQIDSSAPQIVLDLDEVVLVDVTVVRFLRACEGSGIELRHCPRFIREWIGHEGNNTNEK